MQDCADVSAGRARAAAQAARREMHGPDRRAGLGRVTRAPGSPIRSARLPPRLTSAYNLRASSCAPRSSSASCRKTRHQTPAASRSRIVAVKIESFLLERWMTRHETHVRYDIAESGILPLVDGRPAATSSRPSSARPTLERLLALPLGYSEARGTDELRGVLAATYTRGDADHILVTTGAIEANFLLFNVLLEAGDHVIAPYPAYQQLYSVPRAIGCDVSLWHVGPETGYRYDLDALERLRHAAHARHRRQHAAQSDRRDAAARRTRGASTRWPSRSAPRCIGDEAYRWLAVPDGEPFAPPFFDLGRARHQRRHAVEAVRPAGPAHRLDRRPARSRPALLGDARLHHAQPGQAERRAGVPRDDAPRPDHRAQHGASSSANLATARALDGRARRVPRLDAAARRPARAPEVRPADRLARRSPTSWRPSTA